MDVPHEHRSYDCSDYFQGGWAERGHLDPPSQTLVIVPSSEAYENAEAEFFAIGRSGADGIDFGYRKGQCGLWAFYPIERNFKYMAGSISELVEGWCSGRLMV